MTAAALDLDDHAPLDRWRAAVEALAPGVDLVVLVDPGAAVPGDLVTGAHEALGPADARVTLAPVVDAIKEVDADGVVVADVDRGPLRRAARPAVVRRAALSRALDAGAAGDGAGGEPLRRLAATGGDVRPLDGSGPDDLDRPR